MINKLILIDAIDTDGLGFLEIIHCREGKNRGGSHFKFHSKIGEHSSFYIPEDQIQKLIIALSGGTP